MTVPSYPHRLHAFQPTRVWTIEDGGVRWEVQGEDARSGFIPRDKIRSVRLRFEPSRAERRRVGLHIYTPIDHHITNIDYQGVMNFKHRPDAFKAFVIAFHNLFPEDTKTEFYKGSTMGAYIGNIAITAFIVLLLLFLAPIMSVTGIPGGTSIFRIAVILIFLPVVFKLLKKNKPGTYRPDAPPLDILT